MEISPIEEVRGEGTSKKGLLATAWKGMAIALAVLILASSIAMILLPLALPDIRA